MLACSQGLGKKQTYLGSMISTCLNRADTSYSLDECILKVKDDGIYTVQYRSLEAWSNQADDPVPRRPIERR